MSLRCEEVRDRFSALWEKELRPSEEAEIRDHLDVCSECREAFAQFDKTLHLLHSVEEVDVPEGFLSGVYEKLEERRRSGLAPTTKGIGWLHLPSRMKLPIQAFAMVAVVFLALYVTKMTPVESPPVKDAVEPKSGLVEQKKALPEVQAPVLSKEKLDQLSPREQENRVKEEEVTGSLKERAKPPTAERDLKIAADESKAKAPEPLVVARPHFPAAPAPPLREESKPPSLLADKPVKVAQEAVARPEEKGSGGRLDLGVMTPSSAPGRKEGESLQDSRLMARKAEERGRASGTSTPESKPSQELILKVKDRISTRSQIEELMKRLGGEIVDATENTFLVALPGSSFRELQTQLGRIGSVTKKGAPAAVSQETVAPVGESSAAKRREAKTKDGEIDPSSFAKEGRTLIQIDLVVE